MNPPSSFMINRSHDENLKNLTMNIAHKFFNHKILSPYSILNAMLLVMFGSNDTTRQELLNYFLIDDFDHLKRSGKDIRNLNKTKYDELKIANAMFLNKGFDIKDSYKQLLQLFNSKIESVDLKNSIDYINSYIEQNTGNMITNFLSKDSINNDTKAILLNCIYFNAKWSKEFKQMENQMEFNGTKMDFMECEGNFQYYDNNYFETVKIPYEKENFSMIACLPKGRNNTLEISEIITRNEFRIHGQLNHPERMKHDDFIIKMPEFEIDETIDIKKKMKNNGINLLFDEKKCDLTNIYENSNDNLYVGNILHKAVIKVNHKGTEAAAVTAVMFETYNYNPNQKKPRELIFNKPFHYFIVHNTTNAIIFSGKFNG